MGGGSFFFTARVSLYRGELKDAGTTAFRTNARITTLDSLVDLCKFLSASGLYIRINDDNEIHCISRYQGYNFHHRSASHTAFRARFIEKPSVKERFSARLLLRRWMHAAKFLRPLHSSEMYIRLQVELQSWQITDGEISDLFVPTVGKHNIRNLGGFLGLECNRTIATSGSALRLRQNH